MPLEQIRVLSSMTVGIIGFGRIGQEVASRLLPFKCKVIVFDPAIDTELIKVAGCKPATFDEILMESDLITPHCPSTDKTRHMFNAETIAKMKHGVLLLNLSRGDLVKTADLIEALKNGHIGGAGLDVTEPEPLEIDSPLRKMDNVIITVHVASASVNSVEKLRIGVTSPVVCLVRGEKLVNIVNGVSV